MKLATQLCSLPVCMSTWVFISTKMSAYVIHLVVSQVAKWYKDLIHLIKPTYTMT